MITSKLHLLIDSKNLSKVKLSAMTGISDVTISNILKGADAKISSIEAIASALGVPVGYFFDDPTPSINSKVTQKGNNSVMIGNNNDTITQLENCAKEVQHLKEKLADRDRTIEDKERTIQILMNNGR